MIPRSIFFHHNCVSAAVALAVQGLLLVETAAADPFAGAFELGWSSAYVSEGRRLEDVQDGLFTGWVGLEFDSLLAEAWHCNASRGGYRELNVTLAYAAEIGPLGCTLGGTRIDSWTDGAHDGDDYEFFASLAYPIFAATELSLGFVWSEGASGSFLELTLDHTLAEWDLFTWGARAGLAWDFGYASEEFDGLNHVDLGTSLAVALSDRWSTSVFYSVILPLEDVERDGGAAFGYGGLAVTSSF